MNNIHSTAIIGDNVKLGDNITIHPYAILDGKIEIGDGCEIGPYVHIGGWVTMGKNNKVFAAAAIGEAPQDYSWDGKVGEIIIGNDCIIREYVTVHLPVITEKSDKTIIENGVFLMVNNHSVLVNGCLLAGHVETGEYCFISGNVAVHQFCRVGAYSITGGVSKVVQDIPPYVIADGHPATSRGLNVVGLKRNNFNIQDRKSIKEAFNILYSGKGYKDAVAEIEEKFAGDKNIMMFAEFVKTSKRGIVGFSNDDAEV